MADHLIWLEGVDFATHLDDTTNLSVIRGASLGMLAAGQEALGILPGHTLHFAGASIALLSGPGNLAAGEAAARTLLVHLATSGAAPDRTGATPPFAHLRFVVGVAADNGKLGPRQAQARARRMQIAGRFPRPGIPATLGPMGECRFSGHRIADDWLALTDRHARAYLRESPAGPTPPSLRHVPVSTSARARWHYGRVQRQRFYADRPALAACVPRDHGFTESLDDLVALRRDAPRGAGADLAAAIEGERKMRRNLPLSLLGKIAVIYADGKGFGRIRAAMGGTPTALGRFSAEADAAVQAGMAAALRCLATRADDPDPPARAPAVFLDDEVAGSTPPVPGRQLRFEVLLYGGDEICFVAPAWYGLEMAAAFFDAVRGRTVDGHMLTFRMGVALVPFNMPIRASFGLAKSLAEMATLPGNAVSIHAFESVEPPAVGLDALCAGLFGTAAATPLVLPGDGFADALDHFAGVKQNRTLPRSQLHRLIQAAIWRDETGGRRTTPRFVTATEANAMAHALFEPYAMDRGVSDAHWLAGLHQEAHCAEAAWRLAHLWDYVAPLEGVA